MSITSTSTAATGWLADLRSEPWYATVAQNFQTLAPDVPTELWEAELYQEDGSLSPTIEDYARSGHYGLFQENSAFPTTVGLPAATTTQLQDPVYNAYVAAIAMEAAIGQNGGTWQSEIQKLEQAGWPGAVSTAETQTRFDDLASIFGMEGQPAPAPTATASGAGTQPYAWWDPRNLNPFDPNAYSGLNPNIKKAWGAINSSGDAIGNAITGAVGSIGQQLLIGGVIVAVIGVGGALLAANAGVKNVPTPVPVPV